MFFSKKGWARRPYLAWFSLVLLFILFQASWANGEEKDLNKAEIAGKIKNLLVQDKLAKHAKIESALVRLITLSTKEKAPAVQEYARSHDIKLTDNKVQVIVELKPEEKDLTFLTREYNLEIQAGDQNLVQALVPVAKVKDLAQDPRINYIRRPLEAHYNNIGSAGGGGNITSEGVAKIRAGVFHQAGYKGKGIKIAVIDGSFNGYSNNPEIPGQNIIEARSFRADGKIEDPANPGGAHGTACAEIILDLAPEAELYLFAFQYEVEFANAVNYAISKKVDIISFSCGCNIAPFDGTGYLCDIVNNARSQGILFVNSAGNAALGHYEGWFTDADQNGRHEFAPQDEFLNLGLFPANVPIPIKLDLSWDDWPKSNQDYDLYLYGYEPVQKEVFLIDWSPNKQSGTQKPFECIKGRWKLTKPSYIFALIVKFQATRNVHLELYSYTNDFPEYNHPESSLSSPADAAGALAVGAIYWKDDGLEDFSSRGPTNDGRIKPDLTVSDGTSSSIYGLSTGNHDLDRQKGQSFFGTSASAPHVAGAAALLKCAHPGISAAELQSKLENKALDLGPPGKDNLFGAGRVDLFNLLPGGAGIKGIVKLEKVNPSDPEPDSPLADHNETEVKVFREGNQVKSSLSAQDGSYLVDGLAAGVYDVHYCRPGWSKVERNKITLLAGETKEMPPLTLLVGDMNQDTQINILDLLWMAARMGLTPCDPGWQEAKIADVNRDNAINILDLLRVAKNMGGQP